MKVHQIATSRGLINVPVCYCRTYQQGKNICVTLYPSAVTCKHCIRAYRKEQQALQERYEAEYS